MPIRIYGINGNSGGLGDKSLILPDNIDDLAIAADTDALSLNWTIPESEIEIDHFNVYIAQQDTAPLNIDDMELETVLGPTITTLSIGDLISGTMYHVIITSVSVDGYENASIRGMQNAMTTKGYWLLGEGYVSGGYRAKIYYSDDGETWKELLDDEGESPYVNGGWDGLLAAEKRVFFGDTFNKSLRELDLQTKEVTSIYSHTSRYRGMSADLYDAGRFFISGTLIDTGGGYMWYHNGVPDSGSGWISMGHEKGQFVGDHNGELVAASSIEEWNVYDFNTNPSWVNYSSGSYHRDCNSLAYGDGKYVMVGEYNMSTYVLKENIRESGSYVIITGVNSNNPDWIKVIYAEKAGKFFAVNEKGYTFYSTDLESWIQMNGHLSDGVNNQSGCNLVYGNGRLLYVHNEAQFSFYCVDGMNWIAMSGYIDNHQGAWTSLISLYD